MIKKGLWRFALFIMSALTSVTQAAPTPLTNLNKPICLYGEQRQFTIALKANATTGFSWQLEAYDHRLLHLLWRDYQRPQTQLMGAPGIQLFRFQLNAGVATQKLDGTIHLSYRRPWEKTSDSAQETMVKWCYLPEDR